LKVSSIYIDEGSTMKRIRPRAKGRANRNFKKNKPHYSWRKRRLIMGQK